MDTLRQIRRKNNCFFHFRPEFKPLFDHFEEYVRHPDDIRTFASIMQDYFDNVKDFISTDPFKYLHKKGFTNDIYFMSILMNDIGAGNTALYYTCANGCRKSVDFLLDYDLNFNTGLESGQMTPFMAACGSGCQETVKLMLDNASNVGIDLNAKMANGTTAWMIACQMAKNEKVVETLLNHGIDGREIRFNMTDNDGYTGFMLAAYTGRVKTVKTILKYAEDKEVYLNAVNYKGRNAFMLACYKGHYEVAKAMLELAETLAINVSGLDLDGESALMLAFRRGHRKLSQLLYEYSEDPMNAM